MELSYTTIGGILEALGDASGDYWESCGQYGERGYSTPHDASTPLVVLGYYWCRCDKFGTDKNGRNELHSFDQHYPRLWAQMEAQGVQFEWRDEWMVDYGADRAYRTQGDSYSWQPSVLYPEDGDPLTPDSDPEDILTYLVNDPHKCITEPFGGWRFLVEHGFTQYDNESYESGWHPGQTDDPEKITASIRKWLGDDVEIAFALDESSQFYVRFSAYVRHPDGEEIEWPDAS